jgi:UDP-N-acetylmuramoyl-L-alanyl-D-glutamate--2,6-diaminopimelate ligase
VIPVAGAERVRDVALSEILDRLPAAEVRGEVSALRINAVTFDHRDVAPGALHCCLPGARTDGRLFAGAARRAGAVALLAEGPLDPADLAPPPGSATGLPPAVEVLVRSGEARPAMAIAACALEGDPSAALQMVGVTGTNGKTTVTFLVRSILAAAGQETEVIGTLSGARTTPESPHLQRLLADARDRGAMAVVMEVTSHALVQHRVDGIRFDVVAFTNLTQDHLDFHGDMESYFAAKASLFDPVRAVRGVVNADDGYGERLLAKSSIPLARYSLDQAEELVVGPMSSRFRWRGHQVLLGLGGEFNVSNALAAACVAAEMGVPDALVADGLTQAQPVPGRFEPVANELGLSVVVDYAHTPDGLSSVLRAARQALGPEGQAGRVIVVFGCGGDRDRAKRPLMGHLATTLADIAVLTSDNPRSEDPAAIIDDARRGCDGAAVLHIEADRPEAVWLAIAEARQGDVIVIAGKGHETTQELAGRTIEMDDRELARRALARRSSL